MTQTFLWHDYETTGADPRRDRPAQFAAIRTTLELEDHWPSPSPPGEAPPELSGLAGADGPFSRAGYTLGWTTWQVVDSVVAPPEPAPPPTPGDAPRPTAPRMVAEPRTVGAVTLRSSQEALLAELLRHYGPEAAFVLDSTWVLVLPERGRPAPAAR